jgi:putative endonuclease
MRCIFYYTYVLQSIKDGKFYIGWTINLKARLIKHNRGLVSATKYRCPMRLVYYEVCLNKEKAIRREKSLKTGFGRKYLKERI